MSQKMEHGDIFLDKPAPFSQAITEAVAAAQSHLIEHSEHLGHVRTLTTKRGLLGLGLTGPAKGQTPYSRQTARWAVEGSAVRTMTRGHGVPGPTRKPNTSGHSLFSLVPLTASGHGKF